MKQVIFTLLVILVSVLFASKIYGQAPKFNPESIITNIEPIVCPIGHYHSDHHVPARHVPKDRNDKASSLDLIGIYNAGFPPEARAAIEGTVFEIISNTFSSTEQVVISFNWTQTSPGALASASPVSYVPNFVNHVTYANTYYPLPLAEKIARSQINTPGEPDIRVNINQNLNWCFDCTTPEEVGTRYDFVSILLHEIYHGLGFVAFSNVTEDGLGVQRSRGISTVYNNQMETIGGDRTILVEDGEELASIFQGNQLFFNLPSAGRAKLYAPNPYDPGSSISHLDEIAFNNSQNSLMTPSSSTGEVERDGGIANEMLYDMGWIYTFLLHEPADRTIENPIDQDFTVELEVISDNGFVQDSLVLVYSSDEFVANEEKVFFTQSSQGRYTATIPNTNEAKVIDYYIQVYDDRGLRFSNPGINFNGLQFYHQYAFGPDDIKPTLTHSQITSIKEVDTEVSLFVNASDVFVGLDTVIVEWNLNGQAQAPIGMRLDTTDLFEDDRYIATIALPTELDTSDILEYRIIATDASSLMNQTTLPDDGYYQIMIEAIDAVRTSYSNDFNASSDDFIGDGFSISQPAGFTNMAIHSLHPYENAGENRTLNYTYELATPIRLLNSSEAIMAFDEIVLVEPAELTASFGDQEFWDYIIVEGKKLGTNSWLPFLDGYDSRAQAAWLTAYNSGIPQGTQNSNKLGDITLYRPRDINLLENGNFQEGDEVFIRFRLFSDPFARGWGWAIDNLFIQEERTTPVIDFVIDEKITLAPVPTNDLLNVRFASTGKANEVGLTIFNTTGQQVYRRTLPIRGRSFDEQINTSQYAEGVYFMKLTFEEGETTTRKFIIQR